MFGNRRKRGLSNPVCPDLAVSHVRSSATKKAVPSRDNLRGRWNAAYTCATHAELSEQPPNGYNANPNATTAAAQAFLKNQASNASLSSAAAAAALRSRPTSPTSVADVQTKRTLRRSGSVSSVGSATAGFVSPTLQRPTLQRRGSSGSMTERTFRDRSPSQAVPSAPDAPPVPLIPKDLSANPSKFHRRAASLEAPPMRVASPPPKLATGRGSSLGPKPTAQPQRKASQRISSLPSVQERTGVEGPESRGSVNFSYPTGSRPTSPIGQRRLTSPSPSRANPPTITSSDNQNMIYDPNSRRFIPAYQFYEMEYTADQMIRDAANKRVKKKKKIAAQQYTGTHLADGTVGGRPRGTAVDVIEATVAETPRLDEQPVLPPFSAHISTIPDETTAVTSKKKEKKTMVSASDSESEQGSSVTSTPAEELEIQSAGFNTRAGALLAKKPSIVREDREREEEEDETPKAKSGLANLDTGARPGSPTPLPRSAARKSNDRGQATASTTVAQERQPNGSAGEPAPPSPVTTAAADGLASPGSIRVQSVSPGRATHFARTPESLSVKHQPPPRSKSPRKSALKRSNSPRGTSPAEDVMSDARHEVDTNESSNGSALASDESPMPRKKSVRVSFDESIVTVGQAAAPVVTDSPVVQSPQGKKSWFSIGRGKKKDTSVADGDDEVMQPRPALPYFGSVRKKDNREPVEERPLIKPAEPVDLTPPLMPSPPLYTTPSGEVIEFPLGQSGNRKIGNMLSQDALPRNDADTLESREPLPPQVLSVEGSGYNSDTETSVPIQGSPPDVTTDTKPVQEMHPIEAQIDPRTIARDSQTPTPTGVKSSEDVPKIAVLQATPTTEHEEKRAWPDEEHMPGGWDENAAADSGSANKEPTAVVQHAPTDPTTPASIGIAEPVPPEVQTRAGVLGDTTAENTLPIPAIMEETEESDASVYSDAAEDISDGDGDGFQSLDAVVDSPIVASAVPGSTINTPPESPTLRTAKGMAYMSQLPKNASEPNPHEGWEKAQEYWKGLSAEKRRQLEQEARDKAEADEDSDSTIEAKPAPMPKMKKKAATQPAAVKAPAYRQPNPNERTYMIQPGSKVGADGHTPVMRSSMRSEPQNTAEDTHIRKSMRGPGSMRGALRNEETKGKKSRPVSLPAPNVEQTPTKTHGRSLSAASAAAATNAARKDMAPKPAHKPAPLLRRQSSGDSESSFKRAGKSNDGSSILRSMRDSFSERPQSPTLSSRFSLRSSSPMSSLSHMRNSVRSTVGPTPTLRGPRPEKAGRFPSFGRSSSIKPTQKPVPQSSSRFADSSDEEDIRPPFRSRFVDSDDSDVDVPAPRSVGFGSGTMRANRPARSIPKRNLVNVRDSSDLPDSDDEKTFPVTPLGPGIKLNKGRQNGSTVGDAQGNALASGSLRRSGSGRETMGSPAITTTVTTGNTRPNQPRRGSFMSILRRKKPDPSSKVRKSDAESAARRDTPLERTKSDLAMVKRQDSYSSVTAVSPSTPKFQKPPPLWPIGDSPPKIIGGENGRPFTADPSGGGGGGGVVAVNGTTNGELARPDPMTRRFTATEVSAVNLNGDGKPRKKKKFGALRRMFRLDD